MSSVTHSLPFPLMVFMSGVCYCSYKVVNIMRKFGGAPPFFFFANAPPTVPLVGIGMNDFPVAPLPSPHSDCSLGGTGPREKLPICLGPRPHDMVRAGEVVCSTYTVSGLYWAASPPPPSPHTDGWSVSGHRARAVPSQIHLVPLSIKCSQSPPLNSARLFQCPLFSRVHHQRDQQRKLGGKKTNNTKRNISYSPLILLSTFYFHTSPPP